MDAFFIDFRQIWTVSQSARDVGSRWTSPTLERGASSPITCCLSPWNRDHQRDLGSLCPAEEFTWREGLSPHPWHVGYFFSCLNLSSPKMPCEDLTFSHHHRILVRVQEVWNTHRSRRWTNEHSPFRGWASQPSFSRPISVHYQAHLPCNRWLKFHVLWIPDAIHACRNIGQCIQWSIDGRNYNPWAFALG